MLEIPNNKIYFPKSTKKKTEHRRTKSVNLDDRENTFLFFKSEYFDDKEELRKEISDVYRKY